MKTKLKIVASLKIWAAIYPSITLFLYFFSELLSPLPLYVRTLILTITLVPWIVFVGVPVVDSIIRKYGAALINSSLNRVRIELH